MQRILVMGSSGSGKSTFTRRRRPKLLKYFEGLRTDQALVCFTSRAQADRQLADITRAASAVSVH